MKSEYSSGKNVFHFTLMGHAVIQLVEALAQAGRSRAPFPMVSLEFFIDIIIPPHYEREVDSAFNRNEYQEYFLGR